MMQRAALLLLTIVSSVANAQDNIALAQNASFSPPQANLGSAADQTLEYKHSLYRLRKGDGFQIEMMYSPEFNQFVSVQPDGYITLKEVGSIYVEGESLPALTATLTAAYAKILRDPIVNVNLRDFEKPYFLASGQVGKPGKYELRTALTVMQAVAIAGGLNGNAKHSQVLVFHQVSSGMYESKIVNVKQIIANRNMNEDLYIGAGDLIYVPESTVAKVRKYLPSSSIGAYINPVQ